MATADSLKTLLLLCSAQVFQTHTNLLPGNTWITFQLLPTINYWMSLHEYSKKRPEEKLRLLDKARPSTSSWQWRTSGKSVPSVVKPTTQYKTTGLGGKIWIKRARDNKSPKKSLNSSGKKRMDKKGKGKEKEKAPASANVLSVLELADLSIQTAQSIDFSCYSTSDKLEWFLDSGMHRPYHTKKKHFVQYTELWQASKAEITDGKYLTIEGYGTVIGHSIMPNWTASLQMQKVLYIPQANKWLFSLIAIGQLGSMSQTTNKGTTVSKNGAPYIVGLSKSGKLHSFNMVLVKNKNKIPWAIMATLSDYTLWHRRMGHAHQCVIKHLDKNTEGGPHQTTEAPHGTCEGCEKGKSKRLPFPGSKLRAKWPLDLVHSNLDEMPVLSIGGYKYTTTYLDDYSSFGVMFYLKKKSDKFDAFKQYKPGPNNSLAPC